MEELSELYKDSNRQAADHIPVKLRAIGYRVDRIREDQPRLTAIPEDKPGERNSAVELLAKMEHERWSADILLQNLKHDCLKPWDELKEDEQDRDRKQVRAIPEALEKAGFGVYPQAL